MKKLCFLLVCCTAFAARAQAPLNYGFEDVNADGTLRNWGNVYIFASNDSVTFDQHFIQISADAHTGTRAVELRNAYSHSNQMGIAGAIALDADSVFSGWSSFELVSVPVAPTGLGFWYRFAPVNGDTARGLLQAFDSTGNELGRAEVLLTAPAPTYTYAQAPMIYYGAGSVAFVALKISTFYSAGADGQRQPSLGTRLTVDDVELRSRPLGLAGGKAPVTALLYPNPATDVLRIEGPAPALLELFDPCGRLVRRITHPEQVLLTGLEPGLYVARLRAADGTVRTQRVMKE